MRPRDRYERNPVDSISVHVADFVTINVLSRHKLVVMDLGLESQWQGGIQGDTRTPPARWRRGTPAVLKMRRSAHHSTHIECAIWKEPERSHN